MTWDTNKAINEFTEKLIRPIFEDTRRVLEVTTHFSGPTNHGSNMLGNLVVMTGIETVAQFTNPLSQKELGEFQGLARKSYDGLSGENKKLLLPRNSPLKSDGSKLAIAFMRKYFEEPFLTYKIEGVNFAEMVWKFRNYHAHGFYPFVTKKVRGRVAWLYKKSDPSILEGITIDEVEKDFDTWKHYLFGHEGEWFTLCPQVLFVFFKKGVEKYSNKVQSDASEQERFRSNFDRLTPNYYFEL